MEADKKTNYFSVLSEAVVEAVSKGETYTVQVNSGNRVTASGIGYGDDLVLTASHVVEQEEGIEVAVSEENRISARVAGRDYRMELALLRVDNKIIKPAEPASEDARVGQMVLALGRPLTVNIQASLGIVNAVGGQIRTMQGGLLEHYIKTDADLPKGFSGGPLIDTEGRVIGINTMKLNSGFSLAIPGKLAWQTAKHLAEKGSVKYGYLGVRSMPVELSADAQKEIERSQKTGLLLMHIENGSPADQSGLLVGDILVGFNSVPISSTDELLTELGDQVAGKQVPAEILRGGKTTPVNIKVGEIAESIRHQSRHWRCGR
jgi:S1-C subfamily serine protease